MNRNLATPRVLLLSACLGVAAILIPRAFVVPAGLHAETNRQLRVGEVIDSTPAPTSSRTGGMAAMMAAVAISGACCGAASRASRRRTSLRYTTQTILPSLSWIKSGLKPSDLDNGIVAVCLSGLDICVGKTASGKVFAVGDKAPPTGVSLAMGGEVEGDLVVEPQYGCKFNAFTGEPEGPWCPSPPVLGGFIGAVMGGPQMLATFETQTSFLGGEIEVLVDINSKKAYEADYWKGILDAQGKNDGTYY